MFKILKSLTLFGGTLFLIFLTQIMINYLLPYPFNQINVTLLSILWLVIYQNNNAYLWLVPVISFTTDLFSSIPFGVTSIAMLAAVIITRKIFEFFSNFSWYSIFILALLGMFFYKFFIYSLKLSIYFLSKKTTDLQWPDFSALFSEILVSALAFLIVYFITRLFTKRKRIYQSVF